MRDSRYLMTMDKLDRWTRLLGTVLVKVSFVNPDTGKVVEETKGGQVQLDLLHGGVYDLKHGASPYYITELLIGFGSKFGGFAAGAMATGGLTGGSITSNVPGVADLGQSSSFVQKKVGDPGRLKGLNRIYWSPDTHKIIDTEDSEFETKNPYGIIPAVPFFNSDPAHYYFLPVNEPLLYANHASNMRLTDLNHIAKFQSFGIPVVSGVERPSSTRQGRPVDDLNVLKGGTAQSRFGGMGGFAGLGAGGSFRSYDAGFGIFRDGNADAASLGFTLGPDTAVAVGEKGDFKFAHPNADITGLIKVIQSMTDMVRINHGLRPKYQDSLPSSGFALLMEKIGVIEDNIRRSKLFREREQQLFQVVKKLWNTHHAKSGDEKFSEEAQLNVTYVTPKFPVDPKTEMESLAMENKLLDSGDRATFKRLYPYMSDADINKLLKQRRKDRKEQVEFEASIQIDTQKSFEEAGIKQSGIKQDIKKEGPQPEKSKIDNKAKHSENSSKQKNKNGDQRE